jgi:hypothetical protein
MIRNTRRHRASCTRKARRGGGVVTSQQFFDPDVYPPYTDMPAVSTAPTDTAIRPVLNSTFKVGGRRRQCGLRGGMRSGRQCGLRGGFSPSVMGPFLKNAQNAIVPLALYSAYHLMPKKGRNIFSLRRSKSRSRK